jgi:signal transduction histidine kinase
MNLRAKLFPASVVACAAALACVCFAQYRRGVRAVDDELHAESARRASLFARGIESELRARERDADALADETRQTVIAATGRGMMEAADVPEELRARVVATFARGGDSFTSITIVAAPNVRVRFEPQRSGGAGLIVKADDTLAAGEHKLDALIDAAANAGGGELSAGVVGAQGIILYVAPVTRAGHAERVGALVAELKLDEVCERVAESLNDANARSTMSQLIALDRAGRIVFHTNDALRFQTVSRVMPYFGDIAAQMAAGHEGSQSYEDAGGARWLAAYAPVRGLDLSVAVTTDETAATDPLRREERLYVALSVLLALAIAALVFTREARSIRRIERIAQAAQAVADGDLERRLEVGESDRTRVIAESFNLMTERLRAHIRREAEGRQFQAFMRLSAMLTHDLKNAITGLSMLVANMERQFHREEFRADAIASLREATDKLRGIVARLSKPVETLSGEYRSALKPVDLSAVVRGVVETTAGQTSFHEVEMRLPDGLEVVADVERLERVFENLIINALEAMGASAGRLTIEGGREGEESIFITVADTGAGMTPEFINTKLFRPFATTKKQGLGLGLYTCREIVEAHGGNIEVESRPSSGTRFRVVLPSRPNSLPRDVAKANSVP